jgi:hypothetical protein
VYSIQFYVIKFVNDLQQVCVFSTNKTDCHKINEILFQGSPNQAKWATSSPWFQWNRPISVKKQSFSRPVSLFKSVFFSPIIILFLQYSHVSEMWPIQGLMFNILFQTRFYYVWWALLFKKVISPNPFNLLNCHQCLHIPVDKILTTWTETWT